jgi:RNA polymerase sigma factor (sigma-70 family)
MAAQKDDPTPAAAELAVIRRYQHALAQQDEPTSSVAGELNELFAQLWRPVYALCHRYVGDYQRAGDLAQDTMLRALQRIGQYRGEASFRAWVYAIARSVCSNAMRRPPDRLLEDGVLEVTGHEAVALRQLAGRERKQLLLDAIAAVLGPVEQEALHLRYVEGLPVERITALLELDPASGAHVVLLRARRRLRRELRRRLAAFGRGSSWIRETL